LFSHSNFFSLMSSCSKDVSSSPNRRPLPQAFVLLAEPHAQAGMGRMSRALVSPFSPALSCLARFSFAMLRRPAGSELSFLSEVPDMGSLEFNVRGRGVPGRRGGNL
jgi:hypothetical protein